MESFLEFVEDENSDVIAVLDARVEDNNIFYLVQISATNAIWRSAQELSCANKIMAYMNLSDEAKKAKRRNITVIELEEPKVKMPNRELTFLGGSGQKDIRLWIEFQDDPDGRQLRRPAELHKDYAQELHKFYRSLRG